MEPIDCRNVSEGLSCRPVRLELCIGVIFKYVCDNRQVGVCEFRVAQPEAKLETRGDVRRVEVAVVDEKSVAKVKMDTSGSAHA